MSVRARQLLVVATGVVAAAVMIVLGLWQAQVFVDQGNRSASERAAQAPIPLEDFVHPDGTIGDVYGKRVVASGRYQGKQLAVVGFRPTTQPKLWRMDLNQTVLVPRRTLRETFEELVDAVRPVPPPEPVGRTGER